MASYIQEEGELVQTVRETGQFKFAAWLIDVTGWRLIDEIFHIMAYMPNTQFSSYILPLCNINSYIQRQCNIKVVTQVGGRRILKDLERNEIINAKNENSGLIEFITWLEDNLGNSTGIILLTYEKNERMPVSLLAALERNHLLDRFMNVVKGFANVYNIAKSVCPNYKDHSFNTVTKLLLNREPEWHQLTKICFDIFIKLAQISKDWEDMDSRSLDLIKSALTTSAEQKDKLDHRVFLLNKQRAWKPFFQDAMRSNRRNRDFATKLRKCLVDNDVDFDNVQSEYENGGKDSVITLLTNLNIDDNSSHCIADLVDCYFNTENRIAIPRVWPVMNYRTGNFKLTIKKREKN